MQSGVADKVATRVPAPLRMRMVEVVDVRDLAPAMRRVVLGGDEIEADFPTRWFAPGEHVKVFFPDEQTGELRIPSVAEGRPQMPEGPRPVMRDYTIRAFDAQHRRLTMDFVLHEHGPAGRWAIAAQPGDRLGIGGPRGSLVYPAGYSRYLLIADDTALPALARWIEEAPAEAELLVRAIVTPQAKGYELPSRAGMDMRTIVTALARDATPGLVSLITDNDDTFVWAAGEALSLKPLRARLRELSASKDRYDFDGYWKLGTAEFDHHSEQD